MKRSLREIENDMMSVEVRAERAKMRLSRAAVALGSIKTPRKSASSASNGKSGGRPTNALRSALALARRDMAAATRGSYGLGWLSDEARQALDDAGREVRHQRSVGGGVLLGCYEATDTTGSGARRIAL